MKFFSTNRRSEPVSFKDAVINSLPPDRGLYFPEYIPKLPSDFFTILKSTSIPEIGFQVLAKFTEKDIPGSALLEITTDAFNFPVPIVQLNSNIYSLELFHGPTYAFKDIGARFLARCLGYFTQYLNREITILVATSGDTGGAVASAFHNVAGINVVILYPSGKVSNLQEKQLTTLGGNIHALEVHGTFDDCQALVKQAFLDNEINQKLNLSSANSINIARWLPQSLYYFEAFKQLREKQPVVFSVPSGNYGNLTAGVFAQKMGLPIQRFIAASNSNDVIPRYLKDGKYKPYPTIATIANAMDVGDPSNYPRFLELFENNVDSIRNSIEGFTLDDGETLGAIKSCFIANNYITDPHGAIAYQALQNNLRENETGIFLETAHYGKFLSVIERALEHSIAKPEFTNKFLQKSSTNIPINNNYEDFKAFLID